MKEQTNVNFAKMSKDQLIELASTVKETVASNFVPTKNFTVIDLWNIQRSSKTRIQSRHLSWSLLADLISKSSFHLKNKNPAYDKKINH